jgi:molybdenum cofactor biosynthesis enzyme
LDRGIVISGLRLLKKTGGKSGTYLSKGKNV